MGKKTVKTEGMEILFWKGWDEMGQRTQIVERWEPATGRRGYDWNSSQEMAEEADLGPVEGLEPAGVKLIQTIHFSWIQSVYVCECVCIFIQ